MIKGNLLLLLFFLLPGSKIVFAMEGLDWKLIVSAMIDHLNCSLQWVRQS